MRHALWWCVGRSAGQCRGFGSGPDSCMRRTRRSTEMRQHELAKTPLGIVTLWYLGGAKHGFRYEGCAHHKKYKRAFFIVWKSVKNYPKLIIFEDFPDFALSSRRRMCGWNMAQRVAPPLDSETSVSELPESEVWGLGSEMRRNAIFSNPYDPKWA